MNSAVAEAMANIFATTDHYETKIIAAGAKTAKDALRVVAKEIEKDGLSYGKNLHSEPPSYVSSSLFCII